MYLQNKFMSASGSGVSKIPNIDTFSARRLTAMLALLALICIAPSHGWCGSANLWVAHDGDAVGSYSSKQLKKSGKPTPTALDTLRFTTGLAFDKSQNLWAVVYNPDVFENEVVQYTAAQLKDLAKDQNPTPVVIITSPLAFRTPIGCNFDPEGNLWVVDFENDSLDEFSKSQLAAGSADVAPALVVTSSQLDGPNFVTFDASGNAWVDNESADTIVEFSASQMTSGGSKVAKVVLSDDGSGTSLSVPGEIAFDKKGDLWVPNYVGETVVEYAKSQLGSSGDPSPMVKLSSAIFDGAGPWGAAFESKGNLLIVNNNNGTISEFTPAQLKASGAPVPKVKVTSTDVDNFQVIVGPSS